MILTRLENTVLACVGLYHGDDVDYDKSDNMNYFSLGLLVQHLKDKDSEFTEQSLGGVVASLIQKGFVCNTGDKCNVMPKYDLLILDDAGIDYMYENENVIAQYTAQYGTIDC